MLEVDISITKGDFNLELSASESSRVLGVFGASGCGKTTLLNAIAGICRPEKGAITIDGKSVFDSSSGLSIPVHQRGVGFVFQDGLLFPHMTVRQNLMYGWDDSSALGIDRVVSWLGIDPILDRSASTISGGEARRVAIGRAILSNPRILLLDEPLSGLDRRNRHLVLALLHRVRDLLDIPIVYVSHHAGEISFLCDRVWGLDSGKLIKQGKPLNVITALESAVDGEDDIENIFWASPSPERTSPQDSTTTGVYELGEQKLFVSSKSELPSGESILAVHSRDIMLARQKPSQISARNILSGKITGISQVGGRSLVSVDVGATWTVRLTDEAVTELALHNGEEVWVIVKASSVFAVHVDDEKFLSLKAGNASSD